MRIALRTAALVTLVMLSLSTQATAGTVTPQVVNVVQTSDWNKPSPDPMGLTYRKSTKTILVVDSEVEEMPLFEGANVWEITRSGTVVNTGSTTDFSEEPTDIAFRPKSRHMFVADDDEDRIFDVNVGPDRKMGTADDVVRGFSTRPFDSQDAEGLGYGPRILWIADGVDQRIYRLRPGPNGIFDGVAPGGDDRATHFGTVALGINDPEDVEYDPVSEHLFIVSRFDSTVAETTRDGVLIKTYDLTESGIRQPAGIAIGKSSSGAGRSLYVADRGYDNDLHPDENDGRMFEYRRNAA
jgi:DNA-binding beta-propeller fold protein YncE